MLHISHFKGNPTKRVTRSLVGKTSQALGEMLSSLLNASLKSQGLLRDDEQLEFGGNAQIRNGEVVRLVLELYYGWRRIPGHETPEEYRGLKFLSKPLLVIDLLNGTYGWLGEYVGEDGYGCRPTHYNLRAGLQMTIETVIEGFGFAAFPPLTDPPPE